MKVLVVGATGATGKLLVQQLLDRNVKVNLIIRSKDRLPESVRNSDITAVTEASLLDLSDEKLENQVRDCDAIASCLGHNLTWKGIFGHPRQLVTDATKRLCGAIKASNTGKKVKFVLMNTTGNSNRDINEKRSFSDKVVIGLLRLLLPPHSDNEKAADYLRKKIGQNNSIEWVAVRPDNLINEKETSEYIIHASPTRSAIFDAEKTSRINVAHFMAALITNEDLWEQWKGQMPVIYNK
ncbi:MAG TPA: NAD(P)-dependent oxidoreductase [Cyclobacteriaceae bacterium]